MRVERMMVKALRSGPEGRFANDTIELHVALDEHDDWKAVEARLRDEAVAGMQEHWRRQEEAERAAEARLMAARDAYVASVEKGKNPCNDCPGYRDGNDWTCSGCPAHDQPF